MILLNKELKIRLLKSIKLGVFDLLEYPELRGELHRVTIEVIRKTDQEHRTEETTDKQDEKITTVIPIEKPTKVKLLKAIKDSEFEGSDFPELSIEGKNIICKVVSKKNVDWSLKRN